MRLCMWLRLREALAGLWGSGVGWSLVAARGQKGASIAGTQASIQAGGGRSEGRAQKEAWWLPRRMRHVSRLVLATPKGRARSPYIRAFMIYHAPARRSETRRGRARRPRRRTHRRSHTAVYVHSKSATHVRVGDGEGHLGPGVVRSHAHSLNPYLNLNPGISRHLPNADRRSAFEADLRLVYSKFSMNTIEFWLFATQNFRDCSVKGRSVKGRSAKGHMVPHGAC